MNKEITYCGSIAIVGRPNVGKSTLLNQLLGGQKISITSCKPRTTRHLITGIYTEGSHQAIYVDTPGLHSKETRIINWLRYCTSKNSIYNIGLVIFVVEGSKWTFDDEVVLNKLHDVHCPILLVINKVDNIKCKERLLPYMQFLSEQMHFHDILPICAEKNTNINQLTEIVLRSLPEKVHQFPKNWVTDRSYRFIISEIIREKLIRFLGEELPYTVTVGIEQCITDNRGSYNIYALILVKRYSQKKIIIGKNGSKIKKIGIEARKDIEILFDKHVYLKLWVKVQLNWVEDDEELCVFKLCK